MGNPLCFCGLDEQAHRSPSVAHRYSPEGQLIPKAEQPPGAKGVSGIDIPLRLLLMDKGLITAEELTLKEVALRDQLARQQAVAQQSSDPPNGRNRR